MRAVVLVLLGCRAVAGGEQTAQEQLDLRDGDRIVFLGATLLERDRYYGQFETALRTRFPGRQLEFRNMAWPGDTTSVQLRPLNFGSFEQHVNDAKPTVVVVSYGFGESFSGEAELPSFLEGYAKILDLLESTGARILVVGPPRHERLSPPLPDPAPHNQQLERYVAEISKLAAARGYPLVDLFGSLADGSVSPGDERLTEDGIHLTNHGYWRVAGVVADAFASASAGWSISLSAPEADMETRSIRVSNVEATPHSLRFEATAETLPRPEPLDSLTNSFPVHSSPAAGQRLLRIAGLAGKRYKLTIDGQPIATAAAARWHLGVPINRGPAFDQARSLRREVIWKNLLFFHRWRTHNGEYIYGRRSQQSRDWTPSKDGGNAGNPTFPTEMAEFDRLIQLSDEKAGELSKPKTHRYELVVQ
jgi:hypothetical protein